jgi:hypothetical protein
VDTQTKQAGRGGRVAGALVGVAVLLVVLALVLSYAGRALLRSQPFADRAVAALRDPAVQDDVADHLTASVVKLGSGDLISVRPIVRAVAGTIVGSKAFAALFHRAALNTHAAVVSGNGGAIFLNVADASVLVQGALERFAPDAAGKLRAGRVATLLTLHPGGGLLGIVRTARRVYAAAWILAVLAALSAAGALGVSRDRRRTARLLGIGLIVGGMIVAAFYILGGAIAEHAAPPGTGAVARALWRSFLRGLEVQGLLVAGAGAIIAGAASGRLRPIGVGTAFSRGWRFLTDEEVTPGRGLTASVGLVVIGVAILLEPGAAVTIAVLAAGLYVVSKGVEGILRAAERLRAGSVTAPRLLSSRVLRFAPVAVAVAALVVVAVVFATGAGDEAPAIVPPTCNGFRALCIRPLSDVTLAATHNSMASVTIPSWRFGQQDGTIADQLNEGVHGLLIDTYYGDALRGTVRTDLASLPKREAAVAEVGAPAVEAALRIRSRLGPQGKGKRGIYLCHGFCELGAVTLASALTELRSYLVSNPGEVVVVINQDEGVTPTDIAQAFQEAGLLDLVYRGPLGPLPTLREMIDTNQRLVVMAENDAGDIPWYHPAYAHALQETPFTFKSAAALTDPSRLPASCRPNRGPLSAPLFLVNHWVDTTPVPRASLAEVVNARQPLLARAQACERIRHRIPNLIAVDFYRRGDLLGVVNTLNGVG